MRLLFSYLFTLWSISISYAAYWQYNGTVLVTPQQGQNSNLLLTYSYSNKAWVDSSFTNPSTTGPTYFNGVPSSSPNAVAVTSDGAWIISTTGITPAGGSEIGFPSGFQTPESTTTAAWSYQGNLLVLVGTQQWLYSSMQSNWTSLPFFTTCSGRLYVTEYTTGTPYLYCSGPMATIYQFDGYIWNIFNSTNIPLSSTIIWSDPYGNILLSNDTSDNNIFISGTQGPNIDNINIPSTLLNCVASTLDATRAYTNAGKLSYYWKVTSSSTETYSNDSMIIIPAAPGATSYTWSLNVTDTVGLSAYINGVINVASGLNRLTLYNGANNIYTDDISSVVYSYITYECNNTPKYTYNNTKPNGVTLIPSNRYINDTTFGNRLSVQMDHALPITSYTCYDNTSALIIQPTSKLGDYLCQSTSGGFYLNVLNNTVPLISFEVPTTLNVYTDDLYVSANVYNISYNSTITDCDNDNILCTYEWSSYTIGDTLLDILSIYGTDNSDIAFQYGTLIGYYPNIILSCKVDVYIIFDDSISLYQSTTSYVSIYTISIPILTLMPVEISSNNEFVLINNTDGYIFRYGVYSVDISTLLINGYGTSSINNIIIPYGSWNISITAIRRDGSSIQYILPISSNSSVNLNDAITLSKNSIDLFMESSWALVAIIIDPLNGYPKEYQGQSAVQEILYDIYNKTSYDNGILVTYYQINYIILIQQFINKYTSVEVGTLVPLFDPFTSNTTQYIDPLVGKILFRSIGDIFSTSNVNVNSIDPTFLSVGLGGVFYVLDNILSKVGNNPKSVSSGVEYNTNTITAITGSYRVKNLRGKIIQNNVNGSRSAQFILPNNTSRYQGESQLTAVMYTLSFNPFIAYTPSEIFFKGVTLSNVTALSFYNTKGEHIDIRPENSSDTSVLFKINIPLNETQISNYKSGGFGLVCLYWNATGNGTLGNDGMFPDLIPILSDNGYVNCTTNHLTNFTVAVYPYATSGKPNLGLLIGLPVAAAVIVAGVLGGSIYYVRKKSQQYKKKREEDEELMLRNRQATNFEPIREDAVQVLQRIGGGAFGDVYKGMYLGTTEVALKKLNEGAGSDVVEEFKQEADMLQRLQHPNVTQFLGIWISPEREQYLVTEFMAKGSLLSVLRDVNEKPTIQDILKMCQATAAGMNYLADRGVVHRDLAARNLLVRSEGRDYIVKVADFGMSRQTDEQSMYESKSNKFPVKWSAPEILHFRKYSTKSDVWAFGIVMWEILEYGKIPYPDMNNAEASQKVLDGYRLPKPNNCPAEIYNIMLSCWHAEAVSRPTFSELWRTISDILLARGDIDSTLLDNQYIPVAAPAPDVQQLYNNGDNMYSLDDKVRPKSGAGIYNSQLDNNNNADIYSFSDASVKKAASHYQAPPQPSSGEDIYSYSDDKVNKKVEEQIYGNHQKEEADDMYSYDPRSVPEVNRKDDTDNNKEEESMYSSEDLYATKS